MGNVIAEPVAVYGWKADVLAGAATATLGLVLSVLPHLIAWCQTGQAVWFADYDDFSVYVLMGAQAYHDHPWHLADPVRAEDRETYFSSLECAPGVLVARALNLGPFKVNLAWRVLGGLAGGLLWYVLLRAYVSRPLIAAGLTALMLTDGGLISGQLLYAHAKAVAAMLALPSGTLIEGRHGLAQWRILNPSLSLPWLLLYLWLMARAIQTPGAWRTGLAGLAFGLLFYVYFYLWTAAGLGLLPALALDPRRRKTYLPVGGIGLALGAPALWQAYSFRQANGSDWLLRCDKFLPVGHFNELLIPRVSLLLLAVCLAWVLWRRRELTYLVGLALAGLVLLNQQLFTGLQTENFHWNFALGPALALLCVLLLVGPQSRHLAAVPAKVVFWSIVLAVAVSGTWLRTVEVTRGSEPIRITEAVRRYQRQASADGAPRLADNAVIAGDRYFVEAASIAENVRPLAGYVVDLSASVDDDELDARVALNAYLTGLSREEFADEQRAWLDMTLWGPWAKRRCNEAVRQERYRRRMAGWDTIQADPTTALDRFRVRYVALAAALPVDHLGPTWVCLQRGPYWQLWERPATPEVRLVTRRTGKGRSWLRFLL